MSLDHGGWAFEVDKAAREIRAKLENAKGLRECSKIAADLLSVSEATSDDHLRQWQLMYCIGWIDARYPEVASQYEKEMPL